MSLRHRFTTLFAKTFGKPRIIQVRNKQKTLQTIPNIILPTSNSPTRMEIPLEMIELFEKRKDIEMRQILPIRSLLSIFKNIHLSVDSIKDNPSTLKREVSQEFLENMKEYARLQGVGHIGYVKLSRDLIFQELGVLYENALILTMEMSKDMIDKAPSQATLNMVFGTYDDLGIAVNKIAGFLRDHGYSAQADHPFGGLSLFPPLAQMAGLGQVGKHGLLITPEFGPRVRLAAVYTNIDNLPFGEGNDHGWIVDYCKKCGLCARLCPPKAIFDESVKDESGRITHISQRDCFEYFSQYYGCSVCVKVCPFSQSNTSYSELRSVLKASYSN